MRNALLLASSLALAVACKTTPIVERPAIQVPADLSANDVQAAVLYELANLKVPADLPPGAAITDRALDALLIGYRSVAESPRRRGWYPEGVEPGVIYAGFSHGPYYMRVAVRFDEHEVRTRLVESRNLDQRGGRIHRSAIVWIDQLEVRIRQAMGELVTVRMLEGRARADQPKAP